VLNHLTTWIADHGALAVFVLMAVDALLPAGGELVMLAAGAMAAGALGHAHGGAETYVLLATAGTFGYLAGALVGWAIGARGGRALIERHGRLMHLSPERFARAERWFARHERGAVFLGRLTPVVRSFISIPAGVLGAPRGEYTVLTLAGSAIWCFGFAAVGWAAGGSYESIHHAFRYADVAAVALCAVAAIALVARRRSASRARPPRPSSKEPGRAGASSGTR
jgi:membrane protein DedA with SNARE-associated domain